MIKRYWPTVPKVRYSEDPLFQRLRLELVVLGLGLGLELGLVGLELVRLWLVGLGLVGLGVLDLWNSGLQSIKVRRIVSFRLNKAFEMFGGRDTPDRLGWLTENVASVILAH